MVPYLGLLAAQGIRTVAQRLATSPAARKKVEEVIRKNIKQATDKAKIPTNQTIEKGLTTRQKGLLSDIAKETPAKVPTGRMKLGERVRATQAAAAEREAAKEAAKQVAARNERVSNIVKGASLSTLPLGLLVGGEEEPAPQPVVVEEPPVVAPNPRLMQVINPTYESTGKELLNAALLRAGLRMMSGGSLRESLDAAASVGDFETKFRTGQEAFEAGRRNLGQAATVSVHQNSDGTYSYSGSEQGTSALLNQFIQGTGSGKDGAGEGQGRVITPEIIAIVKRKYPDLSDEQIIINLKNEGFVEQTET